MTWRTWALVLAGVAAMSVVTLVVVGVLLLRARAELSRLRAQIREMPRQGAAAATSRVVRAVVQGASRLRDEGLSGMLTSSLDELAQWAREDRAAIVKVAAPDGTVTFFFSDIEDSTSLNERLGDDRWLRILEAHNEILRGRIQQRAGHVVKTVGDGFMAVFGDPADAVQAALAIHDGLRTSRSPRLRRARLAVRIGIHVGPAVSRDGDYFGRNVALAARVAAHAIGGQTLITEPVRDAIVDDTAVQIEECGPVSLKGISGAVDLWSIRR
jgi:adenylate cyclase